MYRLFTQLLLKLPETGFHENVLQCSQQMHAPTRNGRIACISWFKFGGNATLGIKRQSFCLQELS
eukprot:1031319-Amphidinium_carterae.1